MKKRKLKTKTSSKVLVQSFFLRNTAELPDNYRRRVKPKPAAPLPFQPLIMPQPLRRKWINMRLTKVRGRRLIFGDWAQINGRLIGLDALYPVPKACAQPEGLQGCRTDLGGCEGGCEGGGGGGGGGGSEGGCGGCGCEGGGGCGCGGCGAEAGGGCGCGGCGGGCGCCSCRATTFRRS